MDEITNLCLQKRRMQMYRKAPVRFELISPYSNPAFTKQDYDMRRKAEILKYSNSSSKTNSLTKKQKFALIMNSNPTQTKKAQLFSNNQCSNEGLILVPTSSSDVPGPVINLYEDNQVTLYNYNNNDRVYAIAEEVDTMQWETFVESNVECPHITEKPIFTLVIRKNITEKSYTYSITFPLTMAISGQVLSTATNIPLRAYVYNVKLFIYYNSSRVRSYVITEPGLYIDFNVNGNTSPGNFNITKYIGNIIFTNVSLFTEPNYIYDFSLTFDMLMSSTNNTFNETTFFGQNGATKIMYVNPTISESISNSTFVATSGSGFVNNGFQFVSTTPI